MNVKTIIIVTYALVAFAVAIGTSIAIWRLLRDDWHFERKDGEGPGELELDLVRLFCRENPAGASALMVLVAAAIGAAWPIALVGLIRSKFGMKREKSQR